MIYRFIAKAKNYHPKLEGVYHDKENQKAVATNGHILIANNSDYKEEFAGKIVRKNNEIIDYPFVYWQSVIIGEYLRIEIDMFTLSKGVKQSLETYKKESLNNWERACIYNGKKTKKNLNLLPLYAHQFNDNGVEKIMYFTPDNLVKFLAGVRYIKATKFFYDGNTEGMLMAMNDYGDIVAIMSSKKPSGVYSIGNTTNIGSQFLGLTTIVNNI